MNNDSLNGGNDYFMEWKCGNDGVWRDGLRQEASERESSLLDSILILNDEKQKLTTSLTLMTDCARRLGESASILPDGLSPFGGSKESLRVLFPSVYEEISRIYKIANSLGGNNE